MVENRSRVEWIEYLGLDWPLQALGQLSDGSSDFILIMKIFIHLTVCSVVKRFWEAVVDKVGYWRIFIVIASGFMMAVNWLIIVLCRSFVLYGTKTVGYLSNARHTRTRSWAGIVFCINAFEDNECRSPSWLLPLVWGRFDRQGLDNILRGFPQCHSQPCSVATRYHPHMSV